MKHDAIISIENLIGQARYEMAMDYMMRITQNLLDNKKLYNELIKVKARVSQIQKEKKDGHFTNETYLTEINKVTYSIIDCKDEVEKTLGQIPKQEDLRNIEIELLVHANAYASMIEDIDMFAKTIHPDIHAESLPLVNNLFQQIDAEYEILSIEITAMDEQFATATVTQITRPLGEAAHFNANVSSFIHSFEKVNGRWKFFAQILKKMELLNSI